MTFTDDAGRTLNLVTILSSPKEQPFYVGMTGFSYGSGCILGPIVGGALADSSATWRWVSSLHHLIMILLFSDYTIHFVGFLP